MSGSSANDAILYDLVEISEEFYPDGEVLAGDEIVEGDTEGVPTGVKGTVHKALDLFQTAQAFTDKRTLSMPLGVFLRPNTSCIVPKELYSYLSSRPDWLICASPDGKQMAVVTDDNVMFGTLNSIDSGRRKVWELDAEDHEYQGRRVAAWSLKGQLLAIAGGDHVIRVVSPAGVLRHVIPLPVPHYDIGVIAMVFLPGDAKENVPELIRLHASGELHRTLLPIRGSAQADPLETLDVHKYHDAVGSLAYNPTHNLLAVGGAQLLTDTKTDSAHAGCVPSIVLYELSVTPTSAKVVTFTGDERASGGLVSVLSRRVRLPFKQPPSIPALLIRLAFSPSGDLLAGLDVSGRVTIYDVKDSLSVVKTFDQSELPTGTSLLGRGAGSAKNIIVCIEWWDVSALIVTLSQGDALVVSVRRLQNLLGVQPEKFAPWPQITPAFDGNFAVLECERRRGADDNDGSSAPLYKQWLSGDTDGVVRRSYSVTGFRQTSPEELFQTKIRDKQYGVALQVAKKYDMPIDPVFQAQWLGSKVSKEAISDFLSKVQDIDWVLEQCITRVGASYPSAKMLLMYGLRITDVLAHRIKELKAKHREENNDPDDELEISHAQAGKNPFTESELDLIKHRFKFLQYLDRLETYACIVVDDNYWADDFKSFRDADIVEAAHQYAREEKVGAVDVLFTYYGNETLPHRLEILSSFPATMAPVRYSSLIPVVSAEMSVVKWQQESWRETKDWTEKDDRLTAMWTETPPAKILKPKQVTQWVLSRAREIDAETGLTDLAYELLELCTDADRTIPGLDELMDTLSGYATAVYESNQTDLTLEDYDSMSLYDRFCLLVKDTTDDKLVDALQQHGVPFMQRACKSDDPLVYDVAPLHKYLVSVAPTSIARVAEVIEASKPTLKRSERIIPSQVDYMNITADCVYACDLTNVWNYFNVMFESLPQRDPSVTDEDYIKAQDRVDIMERHISAAEILGKYELSEPVSFFLTCNEREERVRELIAGMIQFQSQRAKKMSSRNSDETLLLNSWRGVLHDMLTLQSSVFTDIPIADVYSLWLSPVLATELFSLAREVLHASPPPLESGPAQTAVLAAAVDWFNSASSPTDIALDTTDACLSLLPLPSQMGGVDAAAQAELDLLEAVRILARLGGETLPVQVRLHKNKLLIVEQLLEASSKAYQEPGLVISLARLLGYRDAESRNAVRLAIAHAGLREQDWAVAASTARLLAAVQYEPAWDICEQLGTQDLYTDVHMRCELLAFAAARCPDRVLTRVLSKWRFVERQCVAKDSGIDTQPTAWQTGFAALCKRTATPLLKQSISRSPFVLNASHAFYAPSPSDALTRESCSAYRTAKPLKKPPPAPLARLGVNQKGLGLLGGDHVSTDIFIQLATDAFQHDVPLALAYLLECRDPHAVKSFFDSLHKHFAGKDAEDDLVSMISAFTLARIATNSSSSEGASVTTSTSTSKGGKGKTARPGTALLQTANNTYNDLVEKAKQLLESQGASSTDALSALSKTLNRAEDRAQARELAAAQVDVDVERFASDESYQREVMLDLVASDSDEHVAAAYSLARRYKLATTTMDTHRVDWLLRLSSKPRKAIQSEVQRYSKSPLETDAEKFARHILSVTLSEIQGSDHARLMDLYTCVGDALDRMSSSDAKEQIATEFGVTSELAPILRTTTEKLGRIVNGIDVKALFKGGDSALEHLQSHLSADNVAAIAKALHPVSAVQPAVPSQSIVYHTFVDATFHNAKLNADDKVGRVKPFIGKLSARRIQALAHGIATGKDTFSGLNHAQQHAIVAECMSSLNSAKPGAKTGDTQEDIDGARNDITPLATHMDVTQAIRSYLQGRGDQIRADDVRAISNAISLAGPSPAELVRAIALAVCRAPDQAIVTSVIDIVLRKKGGFGAAFFETLASEKGGLASIIHARDIPALYRAVGHSLLGFLSNPDQGADLSFPSQSTEHMSAIDQVLTVANDSELHDGLIEQATTPDYPPAIKLSLLELVSALKLSLPQPESESEEEEEQPEEEVVPERVESPVVAEESVTEAPLEASIPEPAATASPSEGGNSRPATPKTEDRPATPTATTAPAPKKVASTKSSKKVVESIDLVRTKAVLDQLWTIVPTNDDLVDNSARCAFFARCLPDAKTPAHHKALVTLLENWHKDLTQDGRETCWLEVLRLVDAAYAWQLMKPGLLHEDDVETVYDELVDKDLPIGVRFALEYGNKETAAMAIQGLVEAVSGDDVTIGEVSPTNVETVFPHDDMSSRLAMTQAIERPVREIDLDFCDTLLSHGFYAELCDTSIGPFLRQRLIEVVPGLPTDAKASLVHVAARLCTAQKVTRAGELAWTVSGYHPTLSTPTAQKALLAQLFTNAQSGDDDGEPDDDIDVPPVYFQQDLDASASQALIAAAQAICAS